MLVAMTSLRTLISTATGLAALLAIGSFVSGCGSGDPKFEQEVVIPAENYEISDLACESRVAEAVVDGELVDEVQWWGTGRLTNVLDGGSPTYDLRYSATFEDGTTTEDGKGSLVFPLTAGASSEFSFLVSPVGKTPVDCRVFLYDSVLNYGN